MEDELDIQIIIVLIIPTNILKQCRDGKYLPESFLQHLRFDIEKVHLNLILCTLGSIPIWFRVASLDEVAVIRDEN